MIDGIIKSREVLRHPVLIARLFGVPFLGRCLVGIARRDHTTFLSLLSASNSGRANPAPRLVA
jgi:hypothetical protein